MYNIESVEFVTRFYLKTVFYILTSPYYDYSNKVDADYLDKS